MVVVAALVAGLSLGTVGEGRLLERTDVGRRSGVHWTAGALKPNPPVPGFAPALAALGAPDKLLHMSISANLALGTVALSEALGVPRRWSLLLGVGAAMAVGLLKEAWDLRGNGTADWADVGANAVGTAAGISVSLLFQGR